MATSGSFSASIKDGKYTLKVDWSASQSVTNNTSKITAVMYLVQASGWPLNISTRSDNSTTINGTKQEWSSPAVNKSGGTTKLATVTSGNIAHSSDGTKSVTISATFNIRATISGTYYSTITASKTVTLDTIPRATTPTLSSTSVFMGDSVTISTPRASSSFTHDLAYQFAGGSWVSIATGVATSRTWTVPDLASSVPNAASGAMTIRCITKNGSTTIGTKTVSMTAKVPTTAAYQPTISAVTLTEAASEVGSHFGAFIQSKSKIKAAITAAGAKGSTIKSISTTFLGGTYSGSSWTTGVISSSGSLSMKTTVKDSRGRTASKTTTITVMAYTKPQVQQFDVYRVKVIDDELVPDNDGTHALVEYAYSVNTLNNENTAKAVIQYKPTTEAEWTTLHEDESLAIDGSSFSTVGRVTELSTDLQYDFRIEVTDYFGAQSVAPALLPSGEVILDILADGSGIGIGTTATLPGVCDIKMKTRLQGGLLWVEAPSGTNLDTLRTPGYYRLPSAGAYTNGPEAGVGAMLEVLGQDTIVQRWTAASKTRSRTYERPYFDGGWGSWVKTIDVTPNRVYMGTKYVQITTAGIDTRIDGAEVTVPAGTYLVTASATFNTGSSSGTRNNEIRVVTGGDAVIARQRITAGAQNFGEMRVADVYTVTKETTFICQKSSSITETSTAITTVTAVRLF